MYRNIQLKTANHAVTVEQLDYHTKVSDDELHKFLKRGPIDPQKVAEDFDTWVASLVSPAELLNRFCEMLCIYCLLYLSFFFAVYLLCNSIFNSFNLVSSIPFVPALVLC